MPYWQGNYVLTMTHKNYSGWLLVLHFLFSFIWTFVIHLGCWMPNTSNPKSILHTNALGLSFFTFNIFFFVFLIVPSSIKELGQSIDPFKAKFHQLLPFASLWYYFGSRLNEQNDEVGGWNARRYVRIWSLWMHFQ
jgi:hypothetical protein